MSRTGIGPISARAKAVVLALSIGLVAGCSQQSGVPVAVASAQATPASTSSPFGSSSSASPPATSNAASPTSATQPAPATMSAPAPACSDSDLTAKVARAGAEASQPFAFVTLTNASGHACSLNGYPSLQVHGGSPSSTGSAGATGVHALHVTVNDGGIYESSDPGRHLVTLAAGEHAWFAIGTGTAYDPPLVAVVDVVASVRHPAVLGSGIRIPLSLNATAPRGKPIPVGVTAFAPGAAPSP